MFCVCARALKTLPSLKNFSSPPLAPVIFIAGTTASGKSSLAIMCAEALNGVVVNVDSMQVYSDLRIITARPSKEEEALVAHALYGHVDGAVCYSAAHFQQDVAKLLLDPAYANRPLIFTGGTGLYFKAVMGGLAPVPSIPPDVRNALREEAERVDASLLHARLANVDPEMAARLNPQDTQRILRALEVVMATGKSLRTYQLTPHMNNETLVFGERPLHRLFLSWPRDEIIERIHSRFDIMIEQGAMDEIKHLKARNLDPALPVMRAHGVPWLMKALDDKVSLDVAIERAKIETRQYAKRQMTWWRNSMSDWSVEDAKNPKSIFSNLMKRVHATAS
jgi:tRNA dimethylallyltransferase